MRSPVVGQLVARLPGHPLGNPLFAAAQLAPIFPCSLQRQDGSAISFKRSCRNLCEPAFERFRLRGGDGLDKPNNSADVPALQLLDSIRRYKGKRRGDKLSPFEGICQGSIASAQFRWFRVRWVVRKVRHVSVYGVTAGAAGYT
jgi:hypothetical protein